MQHPVGMGRGYPGYGAVAPGPGTPYGGGAPAAVPGYGYGKLILLANYTKEEGDMLV